MLFMPLSILSIKVLIGGLQHVSVASKWLLTMVVLIARNVINMCWLWSQGELLFYNIDNSDFFNLSFLKIDKLWIHSFFFHNRYRIKLRVMDSTDSATFVLWDRIGYQLLKTSCSNMLVKSANLIEETDEFKDLLLGPL